MKSLHGVNDVNNLDMRIFNTDARFLYNHSTLEEFIDTMDIALFDTYKIPIFKIFSLTFQQDLATHIGGEHLKGLREYLIRGQSNTLALNVALF